MKLQVMNEAGQAGSEIELADSVFGAAFNEPLVHQVVVAYQANGRQGTRKQKTRAEVSGGGAKPSARRAPAGRAPARSAVPCGVAAARCSRPRRRRISRTR